MSIQTPQGKDDFITTFHVPFTGHFITKTNLLCVWSFALGPCLLLFLLTFTLFPGISSFSLPKSQSLQIPCHFLTTTIYTFVVYAPTKESPWPFHFISCIQVQHTSTLFCLILDTFPSFLQRLSTSSVPNFISGHSHLNRKISSTHRLFNNFGWEGVICLFFMVMGFARAKFSAGKFFFG